MSLLIENSRALPRDPSPGLSLTPASTAVSSNASQLLFAIAIFLSAFLLFQVQLLLGKQILPIFGGAPAVWTACILVFQLFFLAGYGYSHGLATRLPLRTQVFLHCGFLGFSLAVLAVLSHFRSTPVGLGSNWRPQPGADPTWTIAEFLFLAIGLPFTLLSATSPLLQHWFSFAAPTKSPYRLYALSNVGSLLGLLSYPFLIEPNFRLSTQSWAWAAGYCSFFVCCLLCARRAVLSHGAAPLAATPLPDSGHRNSSVKWSLRLGWIALAACASVLLLATTALICEDIAVSPFLWVLQLCLYLLSFILCFESDRWYRREIYFPLFAVAVGFVILVSLPNAQYSFMPQLAAYSATLFAGCMLCHGEAALRRPGKESLTLFYFCIATGGAIGGIIVSVLAPWIFPNYWEYPLGVLGCVAVLLSVSAQDESSWWYTGRVSLALFILAGIALLAPSIVAPVWSNAARLPQSFHFGVAAVLACAAIFRFVIERRNKRHAPTTWLVRSASRIALALLAAGLMIPQKAAFYHSVASSRNFYGVLSVLSAEKEGYLALRYGNTLHGFQYQDPQRAQRATGYYGPGSGANLVISNWPQHPMRVGIVGMGVGTLAALAQPGDLFRFYEINADVYRMSNSAHPYFTYLRDSPGRIEVVLGDARVSLEREAQRGELQKFDVLVLDAFSSDAIPMHLLTREAFGVYLQHLRSPHSVIAIHISNQTLNLRPVLAGIAQEFHLHAVRVYPLLPTGPFSQSDWVLLSSDPAPLSRPEIAQHAEPFPGPTQPILWTDDYCGLLHVIRWRD
jgi:hypothetical protein